MPALEKQRDGMCIPMILKLRMSLVQKIVSVINYFIREYKQAGMYTTMYNYTRSLHFYALTTKISEESNHCMVKHHIPEFLL